MYFILVSIWMQQNTLSNISVQYHLMVYGSSNMKTNQKQQFHCQRVSQVMNCYCGLIQVGVHRMDAAKYILKYLSSTASHGLQFKQHENQLKAAVSLQTGFTFNELLLWTDSNQGPQDADVSKLHACFELLVWWYLIRKEITLLIKPTSYQKLSVSLPSGCRQSMVLCQTGS